MCCNDKIICNVQCGLKLYIFTVRSYYTRLTSQASKQKMCDKTNRFAKSLKPWPSWPSTSLRMMCAARRTAWFKQTFWKSWWEVTQVPDSWINHANFATSWQQRHSFSDGITTQFPHVHQLVLELRRRLSRPRRPSKLKSTSLSSSTSSTISVFVAARRWGWAQNQKESVQLSWLQRIFLKPFQRFIFMDTSTWKISPPHSSVQGVC